MAWFTTARPAEKGRERPQYSLITAQELWTEGRNHAPFSKGSSTQPLIEAGKLFRGTIQAIAIMRFLDRRTCTGRSTAHRLIYISPHLLPQRRLQRTCRRKGSAFELEFHRHHSAFRWVRIVSVGVARSNLTVATMDQEFRPLITRCLASCGDRFTLRRMHRRSTLGTCSPHSPSTIMRNNMLVSFSHSFLLILTRHHKICLFFSYCLAVF